jgi:hypothetical protein
MEHIGHRDRFEVTAPKGQLASVCYEVHISTENTSDWIAFGASSTK